MPESKYKHNVEIESAESLVPGSYTIVLKDQYGSFHTVWVNIELMRAQLKNAFAYIGSRHDETLGRALRKRAKEWVRVKTFALPNPKGRHAMSHFD